MQRRTRGTSMTRRPVVVVAPGPRIPGAAVVVVVPPAPPLPPGPAPNSLDCSVGASRICWRAAGASSATDGGDGVVAVRVTAAMRTISAAETTSEMKAALCGRRAGAPDAAGDVIAPLISLHPPPQILAQRVRGMVRQGSSPNR